MKILHNNHVIYNHIIIKKQTKIYLICFFVIFFITILLEVLIDISVFLLIFKVNLQNTKKEGYLTFCLSTNLLPSPPLSHK
jgi:hypothetical protein